MHSDGNVKRVDVYDKYKVFHNVSRCLSSHSRGKIAQEQSRVGLEIKEPDSPFVDALPFYSAMFRTIRYIRTASLNRLLVGQLDMAIFRIFDVIQAFQTGCC